MRTLKVRSDYYVAFNHKLKDDLFFEFYSNSGITSYMSPTMIDLCNKANTLLASGNYVEIHIEEDSQRAFAHLVTQDGEVENISPLNDDLNSLLSGFTISVDEFNSACERHSYQLQYTQNERDGNLE